MTARATRIGHWALAGLAVGIGLCLVPAATPPVWKAILTLWGASTIGAVLAIAYNAVTYNNNRKVVRR